MFQRSPRIHSAVLPNNATQQKIQKTLETYKILKTEKEIKTSSYKKKIF